MKNTNQKGSALIFALIFMLILSVMGASLMFLSQSETWSGMNYKMMTQTRYGAEAGINAGELPDVHVRAAGEHKRLQRERVSADGYSRKQGCFVFDLRRVCELSQQRCAERV